MYVKKNVKKRLIKTHTHTGVRHCWSQFFFPWATYFHSEESRLNKLVSWWGYLINLLHYSTFLS